MQGSKEFFLKITEQEYWELPEKFRVRCKVWYDEHDLYKDNPAYNKLNKAYRSAKKELEDWKFRKRNDLSK